jgi:hypothetical protein
MFYSLTEQQIEKIMRFIRTGNSVVLILSLIGYEVLTKVAMKSSVFWDITPWSPVKINQCFGDTFDLHLHDRKVG